jgi:hypothetical protein
MFTTKIGTSIISALLVVRSTNIDYAVAAGEILRISFSVPSAICPLTIPVKNPHIIPESNIPKHIHLWKDHDSHCSLGRSTRNFYLNRFFIISRHFKFLNAIPTSLSILFPFLRIFFIDFLPISWLII